MKWSSRLADLMKVSWDFLRLFWPTVFDFFDNGIYCFNSEPLLFDCLTSSLT